MGREFQTLVAQGSRRSYKMIDKSGLYTVAANTTLNVDIYLPDGFLGKVVKAYLQFPPIGAAGSTGNHTIEVTDTTGNGYMLHGEYVPTNYATLSGVQFGNAPAVKVPNTDEAQVTALQNLYFDSGVGVRIKYMNNTSVSVNNVQFTMRINYLEEVLG